jgi:hypothetical protein
VVAPGIAEALLATAFGLAAAIPAVVIYNMFWRRKTHLGPKKVVTLTNTKVVDVCDVNRFRNPTTTASCCRQVSEGTSAPLQLREQPIVVWPRRSEWRSRIAVVVLCSDTRGKCSSGKLHHATTLA